MRGFLVSERRSHCTGWCADDMPVDAAGDPAAGQGRKVPALQGKVRVPEVGVSGKCRTLLPPPSIRDSVL